MPPFFLLFLAVFTGDGRPVGFCIGAWLRLHCRNSVCQVFFVYLCTAMFCDL
jgi:hypothetical protein